MTGTESETMQAGVAALAEAFRAVDGEMRALPVYNAALSVEPVGFREHEGHWIGVMITPWFMGVVALHPDEQAWRDLALADKQRWVFPSGEYEFTVGEVGAGETARRYQSLSLFSPMGDFDGQDAARQAAEGAMKALFMPAEEIARLADEARAADAADTPPEIARRDRKAGKPGG